MLTQSATDLAASLTRREISAVELAEAHLQAARQRDSQLRAFLHLDEQAVLEQARRIDERRARHEPMGPLQGLPVALKDVICVRGERTTCGSKILANYRPPYDAHVVERLRAADAVLFGKTNMDEFAMGSSTENSAYQVTRNPWDEERIPGGSSGGSAAAVAAHLVPLALGSDTGGSIRQPAGLCGIIGLKPTYGRVSRYGLVAYGSSLDQIGPLARTVADAALLLQTIAGADRRDSTCVDQPVPDYLATLNEPIKPLTIGIVREHFGAGLDAEVEQVVREAIGVYQARGATIKEVSLPHSPYAVAAYYLVATAEASSNLARYDGVHYGHRTADPEDLLTLYRRSRGEGFGAEVKRRIMLGTYVLSKGYRDAYYIKALQVRRLIKDDYDRAFAECDVVLGPTTPTAAFKIGEKAQDPLAMYLSDVYTIGANLAGLPGISIPCGRTKEGLPIGLQLLAPPFAEEKLLRIARMYEAAR